MRWKSGHAHFAVFILFTQVDGFHQLLTVPDLKEKLILALAVFGFLAEDYRSEGFAGGPYVP